MSKLSIKSLSKSFGGREVLRALSLDVEAGCATAIIGPSGCGKSTLLRCVTGLETFDRGSIMVGSAALHGDDEPSAAAARSSGTARAVALEAIRQRVGLVFQGLHLFPHRTALGNVTEAPMFVRGDSPATATERARELLSLVGLSHREAAYPSQLSGGEQQRVAIARALAMDPGILLLDEPTSALDPGRRREVTGTLRRLGDRGITVIVVTHEMTFAREVSDRAIVLYDGSVVEEGASEELFRSPHHAQTRALLEGT